MFTFIDQAVQAAVRGQGVVLGRRPFIEDLVAAGDLVLPFSVLWMPTGYAYFLLENRQRAALPQVASFRAWLIEQFALLGGPGGRPLPATTPRGA